MLILPLNEVRAIEIPELLLSKGNLLHTKVCSTNNSLSPDRPTYEVLRDAGTTAY
jgi:hypothetical protein